MDTLEQPEAPAYAPTARRPIADSFRRTARGAVDFCLRHDIHPDAVSLASIGASILAAVCFVFAGRLHWLLLIAPLFCYLRLWFNMLDGMVALAGNKASRRGEILNELPDRISDLIIFAGVAHSGLVHPAIAYWAAMLALLTAYVGMLGQAAGAKREFGGWMAKPARMVMLHLGAWITFGLIWATHRVVHPGRLTILDWTCLLVIAGCVQTIIVRLCSTFRILSAEETQKIETSPPPPAPRAVTENSFNTWDGTVLFYRAWIPEKLTTRALILLHRGHEHSGRLQETVDRLALDDVAVFAWDQRGHGRSPGERGGAPSLSAVVKDLDTFARHICKTHGVKLNETALMAHSVGAVIAAAWVHDYAPPIRGMTLVTPAFRVKLYVPFALPVLRLKQKVLGPGHVTSYIRSTMLTHDAKEQASYDADELIFHQIAINVLLDLNDLSSRLLNDAGAITTPTQILTAGNDWVVKQSAQRKFYDGLSSPVKQMEVFPGLYHALLHELPRQRVVDRARQFLVECFDRPADGNDTAMLNADLNGYTQAEFDRLRAPAGPIGTAKWAVVRKSMQTVGRLSDGVRLGWESGFDSGVTLDYVYANRPAGKTLLGKAIDRGYLNGIGWRGIRQRKINLEKLLRRAIDGVKDAGKPVRIMDIAAGAGRYVLETIAATDASAGATGATAILRDYRQANLDAAQKLSTELGLDGRVEFTLADAFDRDSLASVAPKPTIAIVSGLYELFPENEPLRRSLAGLADAVEPGGYLIYTCQPWHPQIELIARALTNREGKPWIMRRRTQQEMDALVRAAGFEKIEQEIDQWGIFTVCLARRIGS